MMVTPACGYCKRTFTYPASETHYPGGQFAPDNAGVPCCDDCYDESAGSGRPLEAAALSTMQAITAYRALNLAAARAADEAGASAGYPEAPLNRLRGAVDAMHALVPALPVSLDRSRPAWAASEFEGILRDLEARGTVTAAAEATS